jgi:hypothetical protein
MQINPGDIVSLKHYTGKDFSIGIVVDVSDMNIIVKPNTECGVFSYFSNDPLVMGVLDSGTLLMSECTINSINYSENNVNFRVDKTYQITEKRESQRYPTSLYGVIVKSLIKGAIYIKNISHDGLAIKTKANLNIGDNLEIEVYVNKNLLSIKSSIVWKNTNTADSEYGLSIVKIDPHTEKILNSYIEWLKDTHQEIINKLCSSVSISI